MSNKVSISSGLMDVKTLVGKIRQREFLIIAADESLLEQLPPGNWIAGTIPYFMADKGAQACQDKAFVSTLQGTFVSPPLIKSYHGRTIQHIAADAVGYGFTLVILPVGSDAHIDYAENSQNYRDMYLTPIIGWVAGRHLEDTAQVAKVGSGLAGLLSVDKAVAMHVPLPDSQHASVNIVNLFKHTKGPSLQFSKTGFSAKQCVVEGKEVNLSQYMKDNNIDPELPLVGERNGLSINVAIKECLNDSVLFFAPVFSDMSYRFASPIGDYLEELDQALSEEGFSDGLAFNCILNYLYGDLKKRSAGQFTGPFTFGEIAYHLNTQTLVYLNVEDV